MRLTRLPNELLMMVVELLEYESEMSAFARTNRAFYYVANPMLYQHNVRHGSSFALNWGIKNHSVETVELMLDAGASPTECIDPQEAWQPVALAAINGNEAIVKLLWERGVDLRQVQTWTYDPACVDSDDDSSSSEDGPVCNGYPSLILLAAMHGHEQLVRFLLQHLPRKGKVDFPRDYLGRTPLMHAAKYGELSIVRLLVGAGANIEAKSCNNSTALVLAAENGQDEVIEFLLSRGADPNTRFEFGDSLLPFTPIYVAARNGHLKSVRCLLGAAGVVESIKTLPLKSHPLVHSTVNNHREVVRLLLEQGGGYNQLGTDKGASLCVAAALGDITVVRDLLNELNSDANAFLFDRSEENDTIFWDSDYDRSTAISLATDEGYTGIVQLLLDHGSEVSFREDVDPDRSRTWRPEPLIQATRKGFEPLIELLLEAGANPNMRTKDMYGQQEHVLMLAAPFEGIFRRLLEAGAGPESSYTLYPDFRVARDVVVSGMTAPVQMLLDYGFDFGVYLGPDLLHAAVEGGRAVFELLLQQGIWDEQLLPENYDAEECERAIGLAAETGQASMVQYPIDLGFRERVPVQPWVDVIERAANSDGRYSWRQNAVNIADASATLDVLLRNGFDIDRSVDGCTGLARSAYFSSGASTPLLLSRGADPLPRCAPKNSPLYLAVECGKKDAVLQLLHAIDARREPWAVIAPYLRAAEKAAINRGWNKNDTFGIMKVLRQWSWRLQYPAPVDSEGPFSLPLE